MASTKYFKSLDVCISMKEDHVTGKTRPPLRPNKTIFADVKASH